MTNPKKSRRRLAILLAATALLILAAGSSATSLSEGPSIPLRLAWGTFDPLLQPPAPLLPTSLKITAYGGDGSGYYIVQFNGPIQTSDKAVVTALGAELLDYIPEFAFIARMDAATANAVESLDAVRWVGIYQPAYRVEPDLAIYAERRGDKLHVKQSVTSHRAHFVPILDLTSPSQCSFIDWLSA